MNSIARIIQFLLEWMCAKIVCPSEFNSAPFQCPNLHWPDMPGNFKNYCLCTCISKIFATELCLVPDFRLYSSFYSSYVLSNDFLNTVPNWHCVCNNWVWCCSGCYYHWTIKPRLDYGATMIFFPSKIVSNSHHKLKVIFIKSYVLKLSFEFWALGVILISEHVPGHSTFWKLLLVQSALIFPIWH